MRMENEITKARMPAGYRQVVGWVSGCGGGVRAARGYDYEPPASGSGLVRGGAAVPSSEGNCPVYQPTHSGAAASPFL